MVSDYVQAWRNFDKAMVDWVRLAKWKGRPILCVFSTPDRAFAQLSRLVEERTGKLLTFDGDAYEQLERGEKLAREPRVTPYPFASLGRVDPFAVDLSRYSKYEYPRMGITADRKRYLTAQRPLPVIITYQVDVWAKNLYELDAVVNQLVLFTTGGQFTTVCDFPPPIGPRRIYATLSGSVRDLSNLEPNEKNRTLRKSMSFTVEGWLCYEPTEEGAVIDAAIEICRSNDMITIEEVLATVEVAGLEAEEEPVL
jgi:hypothetical protein